MEETIVVTYHVGSAEFKETMNVRCTGDTLLFVTTIVQQQLIKKEYLHIKERAVHISHGIIDIEEIDHNKQILQTIPVNKIDYFTIEAF